jgi:hypothetical protein
LIWKGPNTIEFRRPIRLRLSRFHENRIFFGEGTGHAEWWSFELVQRMEGAEKVTGRRLITPFLRSLTLKEDLLVLLVPLCATAKAFNVYRERAGAGFGPNPSYEAASHATLIRHFKAEPRQIPLLIRTLEEIVEEHTERLSVPSVLSRKVAPWKDGYLKVPLESLTVGSIRDAFVMKCLRLEGVGFMRAKPSIWVNIASRCRAGQEKGLTGLADECLNELKTDWWELRLVREPEGKQEVLRSWRV